MYFLYKQNTGQYVRYTDKQSKVDKVNDIRHATKLTEAEAKTLLNRCTKKLKGFHIVADTDTKEPEASSSSPSDGTSAQKPQKSNENKCKKTPRRIFTPAERKYVYIRDKGTCQICGKFVPPDKFTIDHIIPISKGGTYDYDNLQCCCRKCNQLKADTLPDDFFDVMLFVVNFQVKNKHNKKMKKKLKKIYKKIKKKS